LRKQMQCEMRAGKNEIFREKRIVGFRCSDIATPVRSTGFVFPRCRLQFGKWHANNHACFYAALAVVIVHTFILKHSKKKRFDRQTHRWVDDTKMLLESFLGVSSSGLEKSVKTKLISRLKLEVRVLWDITPCGPVEMDGYFRFSYSLLHQGDE
jgi:hypothetical protein